MPRSRVPMTGPLLGWESRLESWLAGTNYCLDSRNRTVSTFKRFSSWMDGHAYATDDVDEDLIDAFVRAELTRSGVVTPAAVQHMPVIKRFFAASGVFTLRPRASRALGGIPRRDAGPLGAVLRELIAWMRSEGYAPGTALSVANTAARLGAWMAAANLAVTDLDDDVLNAFVRDQQAGSLPHPSSVKRIVTIRKFLIQTSRIQIRPMPVAALGPVDRCVQEWVEYLQRYRQPGSKWLAEQTLWARGFLDRLTIIDGSIGWADADPPFIHRYVVEAGVGYSVSSRRHLATALRSLLRWAFVTGRTRRDLAAVVLPVAPAPMGLPSSLSAAAVAALKAAPDRNTLVGRQDYAIVVLLSRLGLRVGEAAGLTLDDLDWDRGQLTVTGKGGRVLTLPIPVDVGEALVAHLTDPRHPHAGRFVFYRQRPPRTGYSRHGISNIVTRLAGTAGLGRIHAHQLRHTAATGVLTGGGSLVEAGELLGHVNTQTTMGYARVDLSVLASLAPLWGRIVS